MCSGNPQGGVRERSDCSHLSRIFFERKKIFVNNKLLKTILIILCSLNSVKVLKTSRKLITSSNFIAENG